MGAEKLIPQETTISMTLIPAIAEDLKELDRYRDNPMGGAKLPVWKLKEGMPYWLLSPNTGEIEPHHYITGSHTKPSDIARYLEDGTIYISKAPYK